MCDCMKAELSKYAYEQTNVASAIKSISFGDIDFEYYEGDALEQVKAGDVLVEYDKLIDQQLERAAITAISGFAKICDGAAAVLNV